MVKKRWREIVRARIIPPPLCSTTRATRPRPPPLSTLHQHRTAPRHHLARPVLPPHPVRQGAAPGAAQRDPAEQGRDRRGRPGRLGPRPRLHGRARPPRAPGPARRAGGVPPALWADRLLWAVQCGKQGQESRGTRGETKPYSLLPFTRALTPAPRARPFLFFFPPFQGPPPRPGRQAGGRHPLGGRPSHHPGQLHLQAGRPGGLHPEAPVSASQD